MVFSAGYLSSQQASELNRMTDRLQALERSMARYADGGGMGVGAGRMPSMLQPSFDFVIAKVTAVDGSGNYSWTEQWFDKFGNYVNKPGGRTGTATYQQALERNSKTASIFPFYALLRSRIYVNGAPTWEFDLPAIASGSFLFGTYTNSSPSNSHQYFANSSGLIGLPALGLYVIHLDLNMIINSSVNGDYLQIGIFDSTTNILIPNPSSVQNTIDGPFTNVVNVNNTANVSATFIANITLNTQLSIVIGIFTVSGGTLSLIQLSEGTYSKASWIKIG